MNNKKHLDQNSKSVLHNDNIIAVTNRHLCSRPFMEQLERVCKLNPHAIVLREKDMPEAEYLSLARDVIALCKEYDVQCILHSFIDVAVELNHPYIHLPLPILEEYAAPCQQFFKIIGTSVHSVEDAIKAEQLGATYMTAGHIFATDCKKGLPPRGLGFLKNVCDAVQIPVYAIGGINIASSEGDNSNLNVPRLKEVMECGAAGGCIMSGMMRV
ncbi:thiamine phosphate synthase [Agathobacter sp.]